MDQLAEAAPRRGGSRKLTCPQCRAECKESEVSTNFALRDMLLSSSASNPPPRNASLQQPLLSNSGGPEVIPALAHGGGFAAAAPPQASAPTFAPASAPPLADATQALAPAQLRMSDGAEPWAVGPQNIYQTDGLFFQRVAPPQAGQDEGEKDAAWKLMRKNTLLEWGRLRETFMHRRPRCLMDQMVSGSGLYPPRLLEDAWFTSQECEMVTALERVLTNTGQASILARDMLTPLIYDIDVRIILDNSGSMQLDMFGQSAGGGGWGTSSGSVVGGSWIDQTAAERPQLMRDLFTRMRQPRSNFGVAPPNSPFSPHHRRWFFARHCLSRWMEVYDTLGLDPWVYLLNGRSTKLRGSQLGSVFEQQPQGRTPLTDVVGQAVRDHVAEAADRMLLLLVVTDGEADNMQTFAAELDYVQNNVYGDVQVCFMGLSLVPQDIEWFEMEECDETRIRTVEAYEVEQRQIQCREVVSKEGGYNFDMHTFRVLLTNFYPADYDYEAPLQNLRHRLYITVHGRDRWYGLKIPCWRCCVSNLLCTACFVATCAHCNGWCQGNECGKYQLPEMLEGIFGEE